MHGDTFKGSGSVAQASDVSFIIKIPPRYTFRLQALNYLLVTVNKYILQGVGVTRGFGEGRMCMLSLLIATVANWSGGIGKRLSIDLCGFSYIAIYIHCTHRVERSSFRA
jgi:hypothetical protein